MSAHGGGLFFYFFYFYSLNANLLQPNLSTIVCKTLV